MQRSRRWGVYENRAHCDLQNVKKFKDKFPGNPNLKIIKEWRNLNWKVNFEAFSTMITLTLSKGIGFVSQYLSETKIRLDVATQPAWVCPTDPDWRLDKSGERESCRVGETKKYSNSIAAHTFICGMVWYGCILSFVVWYGMVAYLHQGTFYRAICIVRHAG